VKKWVLFICVFLMVVGAARGGDIPFVESLDAAGMAYWTLDDAGPQGMLLGNGNISAVVSMQGAAIVLDVSRKVAVGEAELCGRAIFGEAGGDAVSVAARLELHRGVVSIRSCDGKVPETVVRVLAQRDVIVVETSLTGRLERAVGVDAGGVALASSGGRTVVAVADGGQAEALARATLAEDWAEVRAAHDGDWNAFWSQGGIEVGDAALSDAWYRARYRGRCLGVDAERTTESLLVREEGGVVRLFPEWAAEKPAKFADLPAGGFWVSASLEEGKVTLVKAVCRATGKLRLVSPWPRVKAKVNGKGAKPNGPDKDGVISMDAGEGDVIVLHEDKAGK